MTISVDSSFDVMATPDLLRRVLANLVRNAVQHGAPDGTIQIDADTKVALGERHHVTEGFGDSAQLEERHEDPR